METKIIKIGIKTKMFLWRIFNRSKYRHFKEIERKFRKAFKSPMVQETLKEALDTIIQKVISEKQDKQTTIK